MLKTILLIFINLITYNLTFSKNTKTFPTESIDTAIINKRGLEEKIEMLTKDCNWSERIGKKIDVFWLQTEAGDFFGY